MRKSQKEIIQNLKTQNSEFESNFESLIPKSRNSFEKIEGNFKKISKNKESMKKRIGEELSSVKSKKFFESDEEDQMINSNLNEINNKINKNLKVNLNKEISRLSAKSNLTIMNLLNKLNNDEEFLVEEKYSGKVSSNLRFSNQKIVNIADMFSEKYNESDYDNYCIEKCNENNSESINKDTELKKYSIIKEKKISAKKEIDNFNYIEYEKEKEKNSFVEVNLNDKNLIEKQKERKEQLNSFVDNFGKFFYLLFKK